MSRIFNLFTRRTDFSLARLTFEVWKMINPLPKKILESNMKRDLLAPQSGDGLGTCRYTERRREIYLRSPNVGASSQETKTYSFIIFDASSHSNKTCHK